MSTIHAISDFELARLKDSLKVISDGAWNGPCNVQSVHEPRLMLGRLLLQVPGFDYLKCLLNGVKFIGPDDYEAVYRRLPQWLLESAVVFPGLGVTQTQITLDMGRVPREPVGTHMEAALNWYKDAPEKVLWDEARATIAHRIQLCGAYWAERDINQMLHLVNNLVDEMVLGMMEYRELKFTRDRNVDLAIHTHALIDLLSVREYRLKDLIGITRVRMEDTFISTAIDSLTDVGQVMALAYYSVRDALAWLLLEVKSLRHHYRGMSDKVFPNSLLLQLMLEDLVWIWDAGEPHSGYWAGLIDM